MNALLGSFGAFDAALEKAFSGGHKIFYGPVYDSGDLVIGPTVGDLNERLMQAFSEHLSGVECFVPIGSAFGGRLATDATRVTAFAKNDAEGVVFAREGSDDGIRRGGWQRVQFERSPSWAAAFERALNDFFTALEFGR